MHQRSHQDSSERTSTPALSWFNEHPVVATVLWALGADVKTPNPDSKYVLRGQDNRVSDRIVQAISETRLCQQAMSFVHLSSSATARTNQRCVDFVSTSHILYSNSANVKSDDTENSSGTLLHRNVTYSVGGNGSGTASPGDTISPYGFFVAITPPKDVV